MTTGFALLLALALRYIAILPIYNSMKMWRKTEIMRCLQMPLCHTRGDKEVKKNQDKVISSGPVQNGREMFSCQTRGDEETKRNRYDMIPQRGFLPKCPGIENLKWIKRMRRKREYHGENLVMAFFYWRVNWIPRHFKTRPFARLYWVKKSEGNWENRTSERQWKPELTRQ